MVLANLEVVLIRNVQLAGASAAARVDLASPCPSKDTPNIAELNRQALQPAEAVLFKRGTEVRLDQLFKRLIKQEGAIKEHLRKCGEAIRSCDKRTLEVRSGSACARPGNTVCPQQAPTQEYGMYGMYRRPPEHVPRRTLLAKAHTALCSQNSCGGGWGERQGAS